MQYFLFFNNLWDFRNFYLIRGIRGRKNSCISLFFVKNFKFFKKFPIYLKYKITLNYFFRKKFQNKKISNLQLK